MRKSKKKKKVARNANESMIANMMNLVDCTFGGSLECGVRQSLCVGATGNLTSVAMKTFSHLIYLITTFYKCCTFSVICKSNNVIGHSNDYTEPIIEEELDNVLKKN
jgi:hypothetical protein